MTPMITRVEIVGDVSHACVGDPPNEHVETLRLRPARDAVSTRVEPTAAPRALV
jgi:hypothetical protein